MFVLLYTYLFKSEFLSLYKYLIPLDFRLQQMAILNEYRTICVSFTWQKTFLLTRENKFGANRAHKANTKKPFYYGYSEIYIFPNLHSHFRPRNVINDICRFYLTLVDQMFIMEIASYEISL